MSIPRHRVFISYYHKEDQDYKDYLLGMRYFNSDKWAWESIFEDYSVHENEIEDEGLTSEQIRRIIRDEYIKDATVLILLCGQNTKRRKHIDWEIHAAMYNSEVNPQMGIVVINLPNIKQYIRAGEEADKPLLSSDPNWTSLKSRAEIEEKYPYMPSRIIDNFEKYKPITVVDWDRISNNPQILMQLIDNAFNRRKSFTYDHSAPLRRNNS